jgi:uncharacterized membrane protein YoaK (UPF0700 family)
MTPRDAATLGAALAFAAGFADASGFVGADGVFTAHVTGNFVVLAADLARHARTDDWLKLATFPIFVAAVIGATLAHRRMHLQHGPSAVRSLLLLEAALIGAAAVVGLAHASAVAGGLRTCVVALLVTAMGAQNALHRLNPSLGSMTTVMTGNVTQWLSESLQPAASRDRAKHRTLTVVIASFAVGCAGGAWGVVHVGFGVLAVPAAILLIARSRTEESPPAPAP